MKCVFKPHKWTTVKINKSFNNGCITSTSCDDA